MGSASRCRRLSMAIRFMPMTRMSTPANSGKVPSGEYSDVYSGAPGKAFNIESTTRSAPPR